MNRPIVRREFLRAALAGASAIALPPLLGGEAQPDAGKTRKSGAPAAFDSSKINIACIGIGHMGGAAVSAARQENLVALCDVDWREEKAIWGENMPARFAA